MPLAIESEAGVATSEVIWDIKPLAFWSRHFGLFQNGELVVELQMSLWREGASFEIAGLEFEIEKASFWRDGFRLLSQGSVVCEVKRVFWSRRFEIISAERTWTLQGASWFSSTQHLACDDAIFGRIERNSWWTRGRTAYFDSTVPPLIQVLAIFLVLLVASRQSKSQ